MIPESHNPGAVRRTAQKWQQVSRMQASNRGLRLRDAGHLFFSVLCWHLFISCIRPQQLPALRQFNSQPRSGILRGLSVGVDPALIIGARAMTTDPAH